MRLSWHRQTTRGLTHWSKPTTGSCFLHFFCHFLSVSVSERGNSAPTAVLCLVCQNGWLVFVQSSYVWEADLHVESCQTEICDGSIVSCQPEEESSSMLCLQLWPWTPDSPVHCVSLSKATFPFPCLSGRVQGFNLNNEIFNEVLDCFNVFVKCVWFYHGCRWIIL